MARSLISGTDSAHYEVRCPSCNVSFPLGTKRCLHCGGRTAQPGYGPPPSLRENPLLDAQPEMPHDFEPELFEPEAIEVEEQPRRSLFRFGTTSIWILLALIGSVYRVCSGG